MWKHDEDKKWPYLKNELVSIGSYMNIVYSEIRLPRFLIYCRRLLKKQFVLMGVAFILNHSQYNIEAL